jgi:hypothetical protein
VSQGNPRAPSTRVARAEADFRMRMADLGCRLTGRYEGTKVPVDAICAKGHDCKPWPNSVLAGHDPCVTCTREAQRASAALTFQRRVVSFGGTLLGPYVDQMTPVLVRCAAGHENWRKPSSLAVGGGICRLCTGQDPKTAEAAFLARVAQLGATLVGSYINAHTPVAARCAAGHDCTARPHDVRKGHGICRICARQDPATAAIAFNSRLADLKAVLVESEWLGAMTPHRVICAAGHECRPLPANVQSGSGICRRRAGKTWDTFYVVTGTDRVKFGITSTPALRRIQANRAMGYDTVVRLLDGLGGDTAPDIEHDVKRTLRLAGLSAAFGREHFPIAALAVVLDVVDNYPIITGRATPTPARTEN